MAPHSKEIVEQFGQVCVWVHQSWQTRKFLFDKNSNLFALQGPHYGHFFLRLSYILQEYWMQQVAKLHDPARSFGQDNLSVDYMIDCGGWDSGTETQLTDLRDKMLSFASKMKTPRNKLLAHNDLTSILSAKELGAFEDGEDVEYFKNLESFAELIHEAVGEHFSYDDVRNDIEFFMTAFNRGRIGGEA